MSEGTALQPCEHVPKCRRAGPDPASGSRRSAEDSPLTESDPKERIMQTQLQGTHMIADVKCYFCGHISGQLEGHRGAKVTPAAFRPRPGYTGRTFASGERLRCERCGGPVF